MTNEEFIIMGDKTWFYNGYYYRNVPTLGDNNAVTIQESLDEIGFKEIREWTISTTSKSLVFVRASRIRNLRSRYFYFTGQTFTYDPINKRIVTHLVYDNHTLVDHIPYNVSSSEYGLYKIKYPFLDFFWEPKHEVTNFFIEKYFGPQYEIPYLI